MTELSDLAIRETVMPVHIIITIIDSNNIIVIILVRRGLVCEILKRLGTDLCHYYYYHFCCSSNCTENEKLC